ncbi:DUF262 domain-containing protein [Nocardioides dongxiaopingii]|uniref:DUF262 domain-containing protein n=1 Tax=Nocardioides sp. S-1144 TaxID=2582905 RepID=UPI00110E4DB3|nr:DUF262 domain-containing protein [Nocardioides sp. S-1144]QCW51033.1 DUF262 domain-containing protein [Nocardioides sp. S-1144]
MGTTDLHAELLTVADLFSDASATYTVPVYQRNYAWGAEQIEQLISDVWDALSDQGQQGYFLGNLIVTRRGIDQADYEVIDGQQRLTTLFLLLAFLSGDGTLPPTGHSDRLRYQSRPRATGALRRITTATSRHAGSTAESSADEDSAIHQGFNVIRQFMDQHIRGAERARFADFLREKVTLVRAGLPRHTDLNRYFEVMNTRGQQLTQVDIVKARLMSRLDNEADRSCFAWIWDACADMDTYVQMSLTRGDTAMRQRLFGDSWSWLKQSSFAELAELHGDAAPSTGRAPGSTSLSLEDALLRYAASGSEESTEDQDNVRFRSTIEFPSFLLHVLQVTAPGDSEEERQLDDKRLISRFDAVIAAAGADPVRRFAFDLLRCRNLFDAFIVKRQFTATNGEDGDWSLQRLIKRQSKGRPTPGYVNLFSTSTQGEEDGEIDPVTSDLLLVQSMLRVTYTSPRTMHWITTVLKRLSGATPEQVSSDQLVTLLRDYARGKVAEAFFDSNQPTGFGISRIVFTYLDFLLLQDAPQSSFRFTYRNSIEHFYPQHPDEQQSGEPIDDGQLHVLGNLALVSVGANSKFSNSLPKAKAENFQATIETQSPKLQRMASVTRSEAWGAEQLQRHHSEMVRILTRDLAQPTPG